MADLEAQLKDAADARYRLIATDGVFSMDGYVAPLDEICDLAERYDALVMVDDSHAVGFVGPTGAGTPELFGVTDRVDIVTGTLGKALGGASGGYASGRARDRRAAPPAVPPVPVLELARARGDGGLAEGAGAARRRPASCCDRLRANTALFRAPMTEAGFDILPGDHPITPVMIGDAAEAGRLADKLLEQGIYVIGFSYPVVPHGKARIRVQLSAAHSTEDVERAVQAFTEAVTSRTRPRLDPWVRDRRRRCAGAYDDDRGDRYRYRYRIPIADAIKQHPTGSSVSDGATHGGDRRAGHPQNATE